MMAAAGQDELYGLLARAGETRQYSDGQVVFNKGDHGESMFIVTSGKVSLGDGDRVLEVVEAPGLFGEMALIDAASRSLTAVVEGVTELAEIPARRFWVLVHETPYFAQLVMGVMAERLRRVSGLL